MTAVVCAIIINSEAKLFAARRAEGRSFAGSWEFPGGKVEDGETGAEALARELREELQLEIAIGPSLRTVSWHNKAGAFTLEAFICYHDLEGMQATAHDDWGWFSTEELLEIELMVADLALLPYWEAYQKEQGS